MKYAKIDSTLSDDNENKGKFLREALMKDVVIFTETTPD